MIYVYLKVDTAAPPEAAAFDAADLMTSLQQVSDLWFGGQVVVSTTQNGQTISLLDRIDTHEPQRNAPRCIGTIRRMS
jgi:hypothetical protein